MTNRMRYFLPDWEDRVDPNFNFTDLSPQKLDDSYKNGVYAHEIFPSPPCDGILISLAVFNDKIHINHDGKTPTLRGIDNIKKYFRVDKFDNPLKIMGDCGAFSYVNEETPPYTPKMLADLYESFGFDYGIAPDHIVVESILVDGKKIILTDVDKEKRRKLSLRNAEKFLGYIKSKNLSFTPIGTAQGQDIAGYIKSVDSLIDMKYKYIAVGGLVRQNTDGVKEIVQAIANHIKKRCLKIKLHLLGTLRPNLMPLFSQLGIASFDSASYLRKAWLRSGMNYWGVDDKWYTAIRVPNSFDKRIQQAGKEMGYGELKIKKLEKSALQALGEFDRCNLSLDKTVEAVLAYDKLLERVEPDETEDKLTNKYRETLTSRIWKKCNCPICQEIGIHVVIFRGTNRNKRRGFHNTNRFYTNFLSQT